jgi:hypothetical protein
MKVKGVLFDNAISAQSGEAALSQTSSALMSAVAVATVVGSSAYPVAKDGDQVLLCPVETPDNLTDRIVAVITAVPGGGIDERYAFLKRLGQPMPGCKDVRYLQNVGFVGEGEYVNFGPPIPGAENLLTVDQLWRVCGVLYK